MALSELEMIDRELEHIRSMWLGPYRKGIIAGLLERRGDPGLGCPASYGERAVRNWTEGFNEGLCRDLWRWDERPENQSGDPAHD